MRNHLHRTLGLSAAALILAAGVAGAQGKSEKAPKNKGNSGEVHGKQGGSHGKSKSEDVVTGGVIVNPSGGMVAGKSGKVPPGLAKKPGGMPPGQYKKIHPTQGASVLGDILGRHGYTVVRTTPYGESQYVFYRRPDGTVVRALVTPGDDRLHFSNVPAALVREVLARLY